MDFINIEKAAEKWEISKEKNSSNCRLLRKSPFLDMTNLYTIPGTADNVIDSLSASPETQQLFKAEILYSRCKINEVYSNAREFLSHKDDFCSVISGGMLLALVAMWKGDVKLWQDANKSKQLIVGVLFGLVAMYSSSSLGGMNIDGAIINVRDASPLCAGLIFGAPAGIVSGIIGGIFRFMATPLGIAGAYTQVACSVSTILVGLIAAVLRKLMFDDKRPTWIYGVGIATICEIMHMLMIFFTNMNDVSTAFSFVKSCTLPMAIGNSVAVGLSIFMISLVFVTTGIFTSVLQKRVSQTEAEAIIKANLNDVYQDVMDASDENLLKKTIEIRDEYLAGESVNILAEKYNVIEVNIIDINGIITKTNNTEYLGYDMASGEQSSEFLILLDGKYVK